MIPARLFTDALKARGFSFFAGTPCSYLQPLINQVIDDPSISYLDGANEGDAIALASGAQVAGRKSVVLFQNSGLGNGVNALTSLCFPFRIPLLLLVTHRGEPGGAPDEPQHELMGQITPGLLDLLQIAHAPFPDQEDQIQPALEQAEAHMAKTGLPYALILSKGAVAAQSLQEPKNLLPLGRRDLALRENLTRSYKQRPTRSQCLEAYLRQAQDKDLVVCTTGFTGRELYSLADKPNHIYLVGSMGSALSFSLGLALGRPERRVLCFDGDGAVLMRLNNLALAGQVKARNLIHLVLDNEAYESTGGQSTLSREVSLAGVALACGYEQVISTDELVRLEELLASHAKGPLLVHLRIQEGSPSGLGRPQLKPHQVKERLMAHLGLQA